MSARDMITMTQKLQNLQSKQAYGNEKLQIEIKRKLQEEEERYPQQSSDMNLIQGLKSEMKTHKVAKIDKSVIENARSASTQVADKKRFDQLIVK